MPRKTIALIVSLFIITVVLLYAALQAKQPVSNNVTPQPTATAQPTISLAQTELYMSPNPVMLGSSTTGSIDVMVNTNTNKITAVQLELQYDPKAIRNVKVVTGELFSKAIELINKTDPATGKITYAVGISPAQEPLSGAGTVAKITFTKVPGTTVSQSPFDLLSSSLVTQSGVDTSVLKSTKGTIITLQ